MARKKNGEKGSSEKGASRRRFIKGTVGGAVLGAAALSASSLLPGVSATPSKPGVRALVAGSSGPISAIPTTWDYSADVVVVGQGGAGCAAAITAHDGGSKVIVLDKAPTADCGNSGVCGGQVFSPVLASNGGSLEDFITYHKMIHWGTVNDDELIAALCTGIANYPAWIESLGGKVTYVPFVSSVPRSLVTGFVNPSFQSTANWSNYCYIEKPNGSQGAGVDTMVFLLGQMASRNIQVLQSTPAEKLFQDPNTREIIGVQATNAVGDTVNVQANQGVILACGGYENNQEMINNYLPWSHSNAPYVTFFGTPYNTGDGITMAQSVGAKLWHMNNKEWTGTGYACKAASIELGCGFSMSSDFAASPYAFIVNRYGQRFMNEIVYDIHTAQLLPPEQLVELNGLAADVAPFSPQYANLPSNLPAGVTTTTTDYVDYPNVPFYLIFDSQLMKAGALASSTWLGTLSALHPSPTYTWSPDNSVELAKGWIIQGPDPTTLGNNIVCYDYFGRVVGMDAANLAATITKFNSYATSGVDSDFGRPAAAMKPLNSPPYYAVELCIISLNTNGGPVHDKYGRTIDVYNNPIPRLYSVGELGSIFGFLYHSGGNFPEAMVMGQYAGAHAATLPRYTPST